MQLGEIVFGGIGSGIYGMLAFVLLTVFIAGLMVGRTPEYLGKKVDPFDMKMASVIILTPSLLSLIGTAVAIMLPMITEWLHTTGAHGFTEALYNYTSLANNNGSSFAGFASDTLFTNLAGAGIMAIARFVPMIAAIYLAGNFAGKKQVAVTEGTLSTSDGLFTAFLLGVILIIGALSYLPALTLGPIADFFATR
jgi:K+-transporting ATPase ATPase A chain